MEKLLENDITYAIRGAAFNVYNTLGPGLLESVYEGAMVHELSKAGWSVENQVPIDILYDGVSLGLGFRMDLFVESKVIVEIKSVEALKPVHKKQLSTYLKLSDVKVGLLVNFNTDNLSNDIIRIVNGL